MARAVYVDCFSGASGDMLLGALPDAGVSLDDLRAGLTSLPVSGWSLDAEAVQSHGLRGTRANVRLTQPDQPHRGLSEVVRIVRQGALAADVRDRPCAVFEQLAEVEANMHGASIEEVAFDG